MRGVVGWGVHLPHRRLDRTQIASVAGGGGGKGTRTVASYDEDSTTMAVAAARAAVRGVDEPVRGLWLATTSPTYVDKSNATAVHAALRLDRSTPAFDAVGSVRSTVGALFAAIAGRCGVLVTASDVRVGRPGGPDEAAGGDAAAAVFLGDGDGAPVLAEVVGVASATEEFLDRWRVPGALGQAGIEADTVDALVVAGLHERACASVAKKSGVAPDRILDRMAGSVGNPGAAQPLLLLAAALEKAQPGQTIVLLVLADGADAVVLRTTEALATYRPQRTVEAQVASGAPVAYGRYLAWRGLLPVEPPRRPEPARPSASAAGRTADWKFGLTTAEGVLADQRGTVTTFTIDKLAYSPSPPVVFAVVDFDDGERLPVELTDVDADEVQIGMRVEMTFRRLFTADGIANYFWKARPLRDNGASGAGGEV